MPSVRALAVPILAVVLALTGGVLAPARGQPGAITVEDPYFRSSNPRAGAAFMILVNSGDVPDRLIAAASDIAAGGRHALARGGDHVMFMGLTARPDQGATIGLTLTFEKAGEITLEIPVDHARRPAAHGN